ncbi:hypothetical protein JEK10_25025, partial [Klebsiella quasipneumoniae]|uniref:hypothetical protein n=1 Tax=Klebsiella quasipneumoniae TaxID=1463165 RepID=UPI00210E36A1
VGMGRTIRCHRQNMKTSIINGSEVSRLSVAIHTPSSILLGIIYSLIFIRTNEYFQLYSGQMKGRYGFVE